MAQDTYRTCVLAGFYFYCSSQCNKLQCIPPPGLRTLYRLDYYTYDRVALNATQNVRARHYLLTTSKEERDQLLKSKDNKKEHWGCSADTAGFLDGAGFFPDNPSPSDCVLGFVY